MQKNKNDQKYDSDITKHDLDILGDKNENLRKDGGDDQQLLDRANPVDFEGEDLDIPDRTLLENRSKKKLKDEENQLYSQDGQDSDNS